MGEVFVDAVGDGAVVIQGRENVFDGSHHVFKAQDIQEGFLLTGKRGIRQVFCGGRGANRNRNVSTGVCNHVVVGGFDFCLQFFRERGFDDKLANFFADAHQFADIVNI